MYYGWSAFAWGLTSLGWAFIFIQTHSWGALTVSLLSAALMVYYRLMQETKDGD